ASETPASGGTSGRYYAQVRRPEGRLNPLLGLLERWRADAAVLRRRGAIATADALTTCIEELATALEAAALEPPALARAAAEPGRDAFRRATRSRAPALELGAAQVPPRRARRPARPADPPRASLAPARPTTRAARGPARASGEEAPMSKRRKFWSRSLGEYGA